MIRSHFATALWTVVLAWSAQVTAQTAAKPASLRIIQVGQAGSITVAFMSSPNWRVVGNTLQPLQLVVPPLQPPMPSPFNPLPKPPIIREGCLSAKCVPGDLGGAPPIVVPIQVDINAIEILNRCRVAKCPPEWFRGQYGLNREVAPVVSERCKVVRTTSDSDLCNTTFQNACNASALCTYLKAENERLILERLRKNCTFFPSCVDPLINDKDKDKPPVKKTDTQANLEKKAKDCEGDSSPYCNTVRNSLDQIRQINDPSHPDYISD